MDGPEGYCARCNKPDREIQIMYDIMYLWNLKNKLLKITKKKHTHRQLPVGRWKWGGARQGQGTIMYKINKLQECIVQHREYSQCFVITIEYNL